MRGRSIGCLASALLVLGSPTLALDRASCKLTEHDLAVLATLKRPIIRDAHGKLVLGGKLMSELQIQDMCTTRRIYDLMMDREKHGRSLTLKEIEDSGYVPAYLTEDEKQRLGNHIDRAIH
jgi:hypothetical protein